MRDVPSGRQADRLMRAQRLDELPPYLFVEIDRLKERRRLAGHSLLDLGIGDPDLGAPPELVAALVTALPAREHHRYPPDRGLPALIDAVRAWARSRHGVSLGEDEILVTIGSKEAIGHLPLAIADPGDAVIVPDPGYPVYHSAAVFAGARSVRCPLDAAAGYRPKLDALAARDLDRARLMFINYPNNPTAAVADEPLYRDCIAFAAKHGLVLAGDSAYGEIWYEEPSPPLFPTARAAGAAYIEFFSFSKTFSVAGWRVGFAIGSPAVVSALAKLKNNLDSGVFGCIQQAAAEVLSGPFDAVMERTRAVYRERRDILAGHLSRAGLEFTKPRATFYFWIRTPGGMSSIECCRLLIETLDIVATPGVGFGPGGEGYFRLSITTGTDTVREAGRRLETLGARLENG
jgi:LL-diaminopimelate aminotransferase